MSKIRFSSLLVNLFILAFIFLSSCKRDSRPVGNEEMDKALFEMAQLLDNTYQKFYDNAAITNGNPFEAIMLTDDWVKSQPSVVETSVIDSTYISITTKSGLKTSFSFNTLDKDGKSVFRGRGGSNMLRQSTGDGCSNLIENKKVLFYAPVSEFIPDQSVLDIFENSDIGFDVTVLKKSQCTPEIFQTFKDYGLVVIETHGEPNGFLTGSGIDLSELPNDFIMFRDLAIESIGVANYDRLLSGRLSLMLRADYNPLDINWWIAGSLKRKYFEIWITSKYIQESPMLNNTIVLGNMCFSGYEKTDEPRGVPDPIATAFLSRNPISYYGYAFNNGASWPLYSDFAREMEDSLIRSLVIDKDSTGSAYLKFDYSEFNDPKVFTMPSFNLGLYYFKHYGSPSWCYGGCGETFTDDRDGKEYKSVCIGKQVWMAENLNWAGAGVCYDNVSSNCNNYGRLYNIQEVTNLATSRDSTIVKGICPKGWHVPSKAEYQTLFTFSGGAEAAADKLRSATGWPSSHSDALKYNLKPAGHKTGDEASDIFRNMGTDAKLWTSSKSGNFYDAVNAYHPNIIIGNYSPEWRFSCRCVKD